MINKIALTIGGNKIEAPGGIPEGGTNTAENVVQGGVTFLMVLAVLISFAYLLWGGIDWITSEGDKEKKKRAKDKVTWAIIGLAIVFLALFAMQMLGVVVGIKFI